MWIVIEAGPYFRFCSKESPDKGKKNLHATKTDGFWYFFLMRFVYTRWIIMALNFHSLLFCTTMNYMKLHFSAEKKRKQFLCNSRKREKKSGMKKSTWSIPMAPKKKTHTHTRNTKQLKGVFFFVSGQRNRLAVRLQCAVFKIFARKKRVDSMRASNKKKRLAKRNESREKKFRQRTTKYKYGVYYIVYAL